MYNKYLIIQLCLFLIGFVSCKKDTGFLDSEGSLSLSVGVSDKVETVSRSLAAEEQTALEQNCKIRIYKGETLVQKYQGLENLPEKISLASGDYSVRVTAGDSVAASFEQRFFEGTKDFTITKGTNSTVEVNCGIANTVVAIVWDESLKEAFKDDCQVTITSSTGELVYSSADPDAKGYFSLPEDNRKLTCKFSATKLDGGEYVRSSELTDLNPATLYNLTYSYTSVEQGPTGGAALQIQIDETPLQEEEHVITLKQRPVITCKDANELTCDLEQPMYLEIGAQNDYYVQVASSSKLEELMIQNEKFQEWGFYNQFDMLQLGNEEQNLNNLGIIIKDKKSDAIKGDFWTIQFSKKLIAKMTANEGSISTTIEATDENGKSRKVVWTIVASNATMVTDEIIPYEVWTSKATLHGTVRTALTSTPKFRYHEKNTADWVTVDATLTDNSFSKEITGLKPGTTYEYQAMDGEQASSVTCEFTTEEAAQLPNSSFESWSGDSPKYIFGSGEEMFWDSGNQGASTIGENITLPDGTYRHSGNYSAKLKSRIIVGQFAAGNIFIGKYLKTEMSGLTGNGVLGFGRPFASRPKALHGYIRYESGVVDKGGDKIESGVNDKGIIYIALTSGDGESYDDGSTWSCIVRTKSQKYFDKNATNIVAYGEQIWDSNTDGDGMIEFTIPLDYRKLDEVPNRIVLVAAASQFGDYFQGSSGSTMWLDDMELIYE